MPPPPPSREGTLSRVESAARGERGGEGAGKAGGAVEGGAAGAAVSSPPGRPQEETNGVAVVAQQELEFNTKVRG